MLVQDQLSAPIVVRRNRRAYPRLMADQLHWVERAYLTDGPSVSLIDLSVRGAFFEVDCRLRPGDVTNLELVAADDRTVANGHIVRTEISELSADGVRYRGACEFDRPLPWSQRLSGHEQPLALHSVRPMDYQPWYGCSEIRLTFRYSRHLHGYTRAFHGSASVVNLWPSCAASNRERQTVPLSLLRAITFVRDLDDAGRPQPGEGADAPPLLPVEVTFRNNDVLRGETPGYEPGQIGFWVLPSKPYVEPARVFAISSAVREICFL